MELVAQGWVLLDVRPPTEISKVAIPGAVEVRRVTHLTHQELLHGQAAITHTHFLHYFWFPKSFT